MEKLWSKREYLIPGTIIVLNLFAQNFNFGKLVNVFTDEGVYLYAAQLIKTGHLPYVDFFLGQPPFLILFITLILKLINSNMILFHFFYTLWVYSLICPLYFLIKKFTNSILSATMALLLFSTYQELAQWGMHQFDLRQAALPFLTYALYFIYVGFKPRLAGVLLALFALGIVTNLILAIIFLGLFFVNQLIFKSPTSQKTKKILFLFGLISFSGYLLSLALPNAYNNFIGYQLGRPFLSYSVRFSWLMDNIKTNWPLFFFGLLGSFFMINKKYGFLGLFNLLGLPFIVFIGSNYYPHYLTILSVGLTIAAGVAINRLDQLRLKLAVILLIILGIYNTSYQNLKYQLFEKQTPDFFQAVEVLKKSPEPLFTFEPIYGLWSYKNLTFHYHVSDMRYFRVLGKNLSDEEYLELLKKSNTILIEPFAKSMLPENVFSYIHNNFSQVYFDNNQQIYVRGL